MTTMPITTTSAFSIISTTTTQGLGIQTTTTTTTPSRSFVLKYTVFGGIDEDDDTNDSDDAEPNFWAQRKAASAAVNGGPGDLSGYRERGDDYFSDIDNDINVDAYANGAIGGIMPGFQLSGLCGDD